MYAVHKEIVFRNSGYTVALRDVKYGRKRIFCGKVICATSDYIVIGHWDKWNIVGKHELVVDNSGNNVNNNCNVCVIVGDKLIVPFYCYFSGIFIDKKYSNSVVYNLIDGSKQDKCLVLNGDSNNVVLLPNNKILVHWRSVINFEFSSWNHFMNDSPCSKCLKYGCCCYEIKGIRWPILVGLNEIISIWQNTLYVQGFIVYDLDYNIKYYINIIVYRVKFDYQKIAVDGSGVIFLWNDNILLVVKDGNVNVIHNIFRVQVYSVYYGVFVDKDMKLYRICCGRLVRHKLDYDLWHDNDKPDDIVLIINILIELCLFPVEICNVVYCELCVMSDGLVYTKN